MVQSETAICNRNIDIGIPFRMHKVQVKLELILGRKVDRTYVAIVNPLAPELFFFLILAHPVYKM